MSDPLTVDELVSAAEEANTRGDVVARGFYVKAATDGLRAAVQVAEDRVTLAEIHQATLLETYGVDE
jgi:hypothetical protein